MLLAEIDYGREAANMKLFRSTFADDNGFKIPAVIEEFSKKLESLGAEHYIDQGQGGHQAGYFEKKFYGPERVLFDIAEHPWAGCEPLPAETKEAAE